VASAPADDDAASVWRIARLATIAVEFKIALAQRFATRAPTERAPTNARDRRAAATQPAGLGDAAEAAPVEFVAVVPIVALEAMVIAVAKPLSFGRS
jgi:hypothetical protein